MKRIKIGGVAAAIFLAASSWASSLEVTDVKIAQRYPWNGLVDITYTVKSDDAEKDVWVYPVGYDADRATSVTLKPQYLSGEGASNAVHQGTHRMTWNMAAQMGKNYNRAAFSVKLHAYCDAAPYMVIDLSAGSEAEKYEVSYLPAIPEGGWTDEPYKTTKMVFKLVLPGTCGKATITQPYYFAIYPLTQQQYCLVNGGNPSSPTVSQGAISYNCLRGKILGSKWPMHQQIDGDSLIGKIRLRTGITIDLPTLAQRSRALLTETCVDSGNPNVWGIYYDGNIGEWCLDWGCDTQSYCNSSYIGGVNTSVLCMIIQPAGVNPVGATSSYNNARIVCLGGSCDGRIGHYHYYDRCHYSKVFTPDSTATPYSGDNQMSFGARLVALPTCK